MYLHKAAALTQADIADARVVRDELKQPAIGVDFTKEGAEKMARLTRENQNKLLAILVDGKAISAPRILAEISTRAQITGRFTVEEATRIQQALLGRRPEEGPGKP